MKMKVVKVSDKGQISIPIDLRSQIGISKGDELLLFCEDNKLFLQKVSSVSKMMKDEFKDIEKHSELMLKDVWDNDKDDVWNDYSK